MKYSIIIPVYNEEIEIKKTLTSLFNLNYIKKNYEIIVINDGSTDNTKYILNKFNEYKNFKIINLNQNKGRSIARKIGAENSMYENLVFIDSRCIPDKEILNDLDLLNNKYNAIVGNAYIDDKRSLFDRVTNLINYKLYHPYYGLKFKDLEINKINFDKSPKGTGVFFCKKDIFLSSQIKDIENKNASDDTKLLKNILDKTQIILKTSKFKVKYLTRTNIKNNIKHIYQRGPKFIDYYFNFNKKFFYFILFYYLVCFFILISLIINLGLILIYFSLLLILIISSSIYLSKNIKDFFICLLIIPFIFGAFGLGLIKGLILKIFNKI